jgi:hypothetical protein
VVFNLNCPLPCGSIVNCLVISFPPLYTFANITDISLVILAPAASTIIKPFGVIYVPLVSFSLKSKTTLGTPLASIIVDGILLPGSLTSVFKSDINPDALVSQNISILEKVGLVSYTANLL